MSAVVDIWGPSEKSLIQQGTFVTKGLLLAGAHQWVYTSFKAREQRCCADVEGTGGWGGVSDIYYRDKRNFADL